MNKKKIKKVSKKKLKKIKGGVDIVSAIKEHAFGEDTSAPGTDIVVEVNSHGGGLGFKINW